MSDWHEFERVGELAAKAAGDVLLDWAGRFAVREKGRSDLVTEADLAAQETVRDILLKSFPDHGFLAEENLSIPPGGDGFRWIVDPLDGTTNYVHGLANFAVSIGLEQAGRLVFGVVYDPVGRECFQALSGRGAKLNGAAIRVSPVADLSQAMVATSFAASVQRGDLEIREFVEVLLASQATRRMGSSALNLCYLAAGRFDAYWATTTKIWDIAAGILLVQEAGGVVSGPGGVPFVLEKPQFVAASTSNLHAQVLALLAKARSAA